MKKIFIVLIIIIFLASCKSIFEPQKNFTNQTAQEKIVIPKVELNNCGLITQYYSQEVIDCFKEAYESCSPAKITVDAENKRSRLEVLGEKEGKCLLNYVIEKATSELENKNLLCNIEKNTLGIDKEAAVRIMLLPADMLILAKEGKCQGSLLNTNFVK